MEKVVETDSQTTLERIREAWELADTLDLSFAMEELAKEIVGGKTIRIPASFPKEKIGTFLGTKRYLLEPCDTGDDWLLIVPGHIVTIVPGEING